MPDVLDYKVQSVGQQVRVYGKVVDSNDQSVQLATFGPQGINFVAWYQQLTVSAQEQFVRDVATPYMMANLLGNWP